MDCADDSAGERDDHARIANGSRRGTNRADARRLRQNLPEIPVEPALLRPVARIAERHFLVAHLVAPERRAQMEVPGDDGARAIPAAPLFGDRGAAPDREGWDPRRPRQVVPKGPVIDEHRPRARRKGVEARCRPRAARPTPTRARGPGRRIEVLLVRAADPVLARPGHRPVGLDVVRTVAVVVQEEHRRDERPGFGRPFEIRILGRRDAVCAADRDELRVAIGARAGAAGRGRRLRRGVGPGRARRAGDPQVVVPRRPDDVPEARNEMPQGQFEMSRPFADVARQDQPVVGMMAEPFERGAIRAARQMQIADGEELQSRSPASLERASGAVPTGGPGR